ncbi:MAG: ribonuclease P protein component [Candidatus Zixiibacteriota bacterium]
MKQGKRIRGEYATVVWEIDDSFKYGIFLSRKHGRATQRNRLKRLFREAVRLNRNRLPQTLKVAVLPHVVSPLPTFEQIDGEITKIFTLIHERTK